MQVPTIWYVNVFVSDFGRAVDTNVYYPDEFRDG